MNLAISLAKEAGAVGEIPIGALVVRNSDGAIVGVGKNTREEKRNALGHAEISAINSACEFLGGWRLSGCSLYVTLEPCPMCSGAIINARIDRVIFGAYDKKNGAVTSVMKMFDFPFTHKPEFLGGVLEMECTDLLQAFFAKLRERNSKVKKVLVKTDDQFSRLAKLLPENEGINPEKSYYFLQKNGKTIGYEESGIEL